jgi:site-specific recombinase XerD
MAEIIVTNQENRQSAQVAPAAPVQAANDEHLIDLWLHGRSAGTRRAYESDARAFLAHASKPIRSVTVGDVQAFGTSLAALATASQARKLSAVKSLISYAHRLGYVSFNVGAAIKLPAIKATLAERILPEEEVVRMLALETGPRNRVLLKLLYLAGLRISEVVGLKVRDLAAREDAGQITVFGKGGKTRAVLLPASLWRELRRLTAFSAPDAAVFISREGGALDVSQVHRIVKLAAARAGLSDAISAHWLRHAHVSHALDRGAPAHLVQATVGHASLSTTSRYAHARPSDSSARWLAA